MENEYWLERWKKKEIGFHQESFNEYLLQYGEVLLKNSKNVFIPLCGKTKDILWFYQYHYHILGVEISEIACKEFFEENSISYSIQQKGYFKIFSSFDKKIYIINGDFFSLTEDFINSFFLIDSIYDRASLVAFPYTKRKDYVKKIYELFHKIKIKYVLICLEFEPLEKNINRTSLFCKRNRNS